MVLVAPPGPAPQQLVQHSDKKAKLCRLANKLAPPVVSFVCILLNLSQKSRE